MTPEEIKKEIRDEVNLGVVALGEHLAQSVQGVIKITVNGKIDRLSEKMDSYIKADEMWKEKVEPILKERESRTYVWNELTNTSKRVSVIAGAILITFGIIWSIFKLAVSVVLK